MKVKSIMSLVVLMIVFIFSQNIFAQGPLATYWKSYDGNAERASRQKVATEYGNSVLASQQQIVTDAQNKVQQQIQDATKTSNSQFASIVSQASQNKPNSKETMPLESCDCYDNSNPANYPSNFKYNDKQERIQRILPPCSCKAKADNSKSSALSSAQRTAIIRGTSSQQPAVLTSSSGATQNGSSNSKWQINYN